MAKLLPLNESVEEALNEARSASQGCQWIVHPSLALQALRGLLELLKLEHSHPDAVEVLPFGAVAGDGVVGGGAALTEDLHRSWAVAGTLQTNGGLDLGTGLAGGEADELHEVVGGEESSTGAGEHQPAGRDESHGEAVEVEMFAAAFFVFESRANQLRRIEHDDIELATRGDQVAHIDEGIGLDELATGLVEVGVFLGEGQRMLVEVDTDDFARAAELLRLDREAAGVATDVEDAAVLAIGGKLPAIVALIAKEARLVSFAEVDAKPSAEFLDGDSLRAELGSDIRPFETFLSHRRGTATNEPMRRATERFEHRENCFGPLIHARCEDFGGEDVAQFVDDKPRQTIPFGMDHAVAVGDFVELEDIPPELDGLGEFLLPERFVGEMVAPGEHAHGEFGFGIDQAIADDAAVGVDDANVVARANFAGDEIDPLAEEIGMLPRRFDFDGRNPVGMFRSERAGREERRGARFGCVHGGLSNFSSPDPRG